MTRSHQIAGFLGPTVILLAISEAKNLQIWATGDARLTYQAGLIWFLGGLAIVRLHNRWSTGWPVAITLVGWFFLLGGVFRMLLPEAQQGNQNTPAAGIYAVDLVLLALGVLMTFKAYRSRSCERRRMTTPDTTLELPGQAEPMRLGDPQASVRTSVAGEPWAS